MKYLNVSKNAVFMGILISLISVCGCEKITTMLPPVQPEMMETAPVRVSFLYPGDCLGDSSYCDILHRGAQKVKMKLDVEVTEMVSNSDTWDMQLRAAAESSSLVITSGYQIGEPVSRVAPEFPEVMFVIFDAAVDLPNVASFTYSVNEATFLLGAVAGLKTQTGKVGYLGGANVPFLHEFEAGYIAGVKAVNPDAEIIRSYVADNEQGFYQPEVGKTRALTQYELGVDIIYAMADQSGLGAVEAAKLAEGRYVIWNYIDITDMAPGVILTALRINIDEDAYGAVEAFTAGQLMPGVRSLGLADGENMGYILSFEHISEELHEKVSALRAAIIEGEITVPTVP